MESQTVNEAEFLDKFPYNLEEQKKDEDIQEDLPDYEESPAITPKVDIVLKSSIDDSMKKKHELEQLQVQDVQRKVDNYLDFLCENIPIEDLIHSLERPIEVEPLRVLAKIQAFDNEESFNNLNDSSNHNQ